MPAMSRLISTGHNAFKITSPAGLTVLTDPWRNDTTGAYPKWFLNEFPAIRGAAEFSSRARSQESLAEHG